MQVFPENFSIRLFLLLFIVFTPFHFPPLPFIHILKIGTTPISHVTPIPIAIGTPKACLPVGRVGRGTFVSF